jgi:hypothetical protein
MSAFTVEALSPPTWPDFAALVERHNGVRGGCGCLEFHAEGKRRDALRRKAKERRVRAGEARAALADDVSTCVGWRRFGPPSGLARIKHLRA